MKIRALTSFCGVISMCTGMEADVNDEDAKALLEAGYVEPVEKPKAEPKAEEAPKRKKKG